MNLARRILNSYSFNNYARKLLKFLKLDIKVRSLNASSNSYIQLVKLLNNYSIDLVLDVGANTGNFAKSLIDYGYEKDIISYEPSSSLVKLLVKASAPFTRWQIKPYAVSNVVGMSMLNISQNQLFNSILPYKKITQDNKFVKNEPVKTIVLKEENLDNYSNICLKIDTQGYEQNVLNGIDDKLWEKISMVKLEVSLIPMYNSLTWTVIDALKYFSDKGFICISIENVSVDNQTGVASDCDLIFIKKTTWL